MAMAWCLIMSDALSNLPARLLSRPFLESGDWASLGVSDYLGFCLIHLFCQRRRITRGTESRRCGIHDACWPHARSPLGPIRVTENISAIKGCICLRVSYPLRLVTAPAPIPLEMRDPDVCAPSHLPVFLYRYTMLQWGFQQRLRPPRSPSSAQDVNQISSLFYL